MDGSQKNTLDRIMHDCGVCKKETMHELSGWGEGVFSISFDLRGTVQTRRYGPEYKCPYCNNRVIPGSLEMRREYAGNRPLKIA